MLKDSHLRSQYLKQDLVSERRKKKPDRSSYIYIKNKN